MIAPEPSLRAGELARWVLCGALVIALHGGLAAAVALWPDDSAPAGAATIVMMELAPLAQEAAAEHVNLPVDKLQEQQTEPEPEPVQKEEPEKEPEPQPEKVVELPPEAPPPEPPPPVQAEVTLPPPPKEEKPPPPKRKVAIATAPDRAEKIAPRQRAATQGAPTRNPNLLQSYGASIIRPHLLRFHANSKRIEGVVLVRFSITRSGRLIARSVSRSSGHSELDADALATLSRAQPYPSPPPGLTDTQFSFTLPMRYNIR